VVVGLLGLFPILALPEVTQLDAGNASLRGLTGIAVVAENVSHEVRSFGLKETWFEERIATSLQRAGLRRLPVLEGDRQPLLVVRLQTVPIPGRLIFAWHLSLIVYQRVATLGAAPDTLPAQTWAASASIGVASAPRLQASVREALDEQVTEFVRAWKGSGEAP
jgi:hypothetical protein